METVKRKATVRLKDWDKEVCLELWDSATSPHGVGVLNDSARWYCGVWKVGYGDNVLCFWLFGLGRCHPGGTVLCGFLLLVL
jgi:hypothetical protein